MRTPVQTGFNMQTLQSMYETYNDQLSCGFLCLTLQISRTTTDYYITYHPGQLLSMFGPQPTSIQINYNSVNDNYCRSVGVAIDRTLPNPWWPPYQSGYEVSPSGGVCGSWSYSTNPQMARGSHYLQTAVSGSVPSYEWNAKVYINGVLTAQGYVGRNQILQANFSV